MDEKLINEVTLKISAQQKGKEGTAVYGVGEQLKDICRTTPGAAAANPAVSEFKILYTQVQETMGKMLERIQKIDDDELRNKLISAVNAVLEQYLQEFKQESR